MIYVILIDILYQFRLCWNGIEQYGLDVGRRHCRILILGNINSDATRIDFIRISCCPKMLKTSLFSSSLRSLRPLRLKKHSRM